MGENKGFDRKELEFSNGLKVTIEATKGKYFRNQDYFQWRVVQEYGLDVVFSTGEALLMRLLSAILDKPYEHKQVKDDETKKFSEEYKFDDLVEQIVDECTYPEIQQIIDVSLELNNIDPNKEATQKTA